MHWDILAAIVTNIGMFLWLRTEANSDRREARNDIKDLAQAIHNEMTQFREEQKEFHGRLCILEEKYLQIITKDKK